MIFNSSSRLTPEQLRFPLFSFFASAFLFSLLLFCCPLVSLLCLTSIHRLLHNVVKTTAPQPLGQKAAHQLPNLFNFYWILENCKLSSLPSLEGPHPSILLSAANVLQRVPQKEPCSETLCSAVGEEIERFTTAINTSLRGHFTCDLRQFRETCYACGGGSREINWSSLWMKQ